MILKWMFDRVVSLLGLLLLWPVLLVVAILIKVKMPGGLIWLGRIFKEPKKQLKRMGNYSLIGRFVVCRRLGCELEEVFLLENTFVGGRIKFC